MGAADAAVHVGLRPRPPTAAQCRTALGACQQPLEGLRQRDGVTRRRDHAVALAHPLDDRCQWRTHHRRGAGQRLPHRGGGGVRGGDRHGHVGSVQQLRHSLRAHVAQHPHRVAQLAELLAGVAVQRQRAVGHEQSRIGQRVAQAGKRLGDDSQPVQGRGRARAEHRRRIAQAQLPAGLRALGRSGGTEGFEVHPGLQVQAALAGPAAEQLARVRRGRDHAIGARQGQTGQAVACHVRARHVGSHRSDHQRAHAGQCGGRAPVREPVRVHHVGAQPRNQAAQPGGAQRHFDQRVGQRGGQPVSGRPGLSGPARGGPRQLGRAPRLDSGGQSRGAESRPQVASDQRRVARLPGQADPPAEVDAVQPAGVQDDGRAVRVIHTTPADVGGTPRRR